MYKTSTTTSAYTYINHGYIDDVPIIEDNGKRVRIEVNGFTGWIDKEDKDGINIIPVPANQVKNLSYYMKNDDGSLKHYISSDVQTENKGYAITVGAGPDFMKSGVKYYSYDGNYFYTDIDKLVLDAINNNHKNSANGDNAYYNYYTYLPGRSKAQFSVSEIDKYINENTESKSVLRGKGNSFIEAQNKYGLNAEMMIGISMNESAKGISNIALNKNNIFGINAVDSDTGQAIVFNTVGECIDYFAREFMSNGYLNPKSWKYAGSNLGNKNVGFNIRYASDPYWAEKASQYMYDMDKKISTSNNLRSKDSYQIGIYTSTNTVSNASGSTLYSIHNTRKSGTPEGQVGDSVLILSTNSNKHEIYPDRQVSMDTTHPSPGSYDWNIKGYINTNGVEFINTKNSNPPVIQKDGWVKESDGYWYFYEQGKIYKGWLYKGGKYYYLKSDGKMAVGWEKVNGTWYYLKGNGEMEKGWLHLGGKYYYLKDSGAMAIGWEKVGGTWYYLKGNGEMEKGWLYLGGKYYYLKDSGAMAIGWLDLSGTWYYLKSNGEMAKGWQQVGSKWYYLKDSGAMQKGWLKLGGYWYYLRNNGEMAKGWEKVSGKWYYLYSSGKMATNTTVDGWKIDGNGVGTPRK